jgi:hypothetical protein
MQQKSCPKRPMLPIESQGVMDFSVGTGKEGKTISDP